MKTQIDRRQYGIALIALLALVSLVLVGTLLTFARGADRALERERITTEALAQAKQALIDFAVIRGDRQIEVVCTGSDCRRLGDLPCPDLINTGNQPGASPGCGTSDRRLGRLPWKTLGLPDLRDGYGERLWYALSSNFSWSTHSGCTSTNKATCTNSDTIGTITIRDNSGNVVYDSTAATGVVAVIFSPGPPLVRQGASGPQDRSCRRGVGQDPKCDPANGVFECSNSLSEPWTLTALCNPSNYLDSVDHDTLTTLPLGVQDNRTLFESTLTNGFISGPIKDGSGSTIVNDRFVVITVQDIMPLIERRVALEVLRCMRLYAAANGNKYPWTSKGDDYAEDNDIDSSLFGRMANKLAKTKEDGLTDVWPTGCNIAEGSDINPPWWMNWKHMVFVAVDGAHSPTGTADVLTVNSANVAVAALVAGKKLTALSQIRVGQFDAVSEYLEAPNSAGTSLLQQPASSDLNDTVMFISP